MPKTPEEIEEERKRNPDKTIDPEKIVSEGSGFVIRIGSSCAHFKLTIRSGASPDSYQELSYNLRSRESGVPLDSSPLIQNFRIEGVLHGSFDERYYHYDSTTKPHTVTSHIVIDNPADIPQPTKYQITEPCSFLEVAEQEIRDANTDLRIFPDQPQTIPAKKQVRHIVRSTLPYGKVPTSFPLVCTVELDRILAE